MSASRQRFRQLLDQAPDDAPAIEFEDAWTTWGELRAIASSLDEALNAHGLGSEARVGLILENRPEQVAVLAGLLSRDRTLVTFSPLQPPARLAADIAKAEVPVLVGTPALLAADGVREAAGDALVLDLLADRVVVTGSSAPRPPRPQDVNPGVVVEMLTSGTTGPPKRVLLRDLQFDTALRTSVPNPPTDRLFRRGVAIVMTPMVHIGGFWGVLATLYTGRAVSLYQRFELEAWLDAVERHRPKASGMVPAALQALLTADVQPERLASLRVLTSGTTFCAPELVDQMLERYGIRVLTTYGATEFAGAVALWTYPMHVQSWEAKRGAAGRPVAGVELRVRDGEGDQVPNGERGILEIKTAQSPVGPDAWQPTSDLASIDDDGFLWIHGRADDAIVRGGFKVQPETVRAALERHPSVLEAAVAPLPDARLGFIPVAGVELVPGAPAPTGEELRSFCRDVLLPYEVPAHVVVLADLPRTPSSKVSRVDLLEAIRDHIGLPQLGQPA